jgi:hypothetical protein
LEDAALVGFIAIHMQLLAGRIHPQQEKDGRIKEPNEEKYNGK